jgi:hypothetical protein
MATAIKLERQRQRIRDLIDDDPSRSNRSIAMEVGCSTHTVIRTRYRHVSLHTAVSTTNGTAHPGSENLLPPADAGNDRAMKHGAHSERQVAPRRARILEELRQRFTGVDDDLLRVQARRRAQIELVSTWLDEHGVIRGGKRGEIVPAAAFAERLAVSYERQHERLVELQREAQTVDPGEALRTHVAKLNAGRANGGEGDGVHAN